MVTPKVVYNKGSEAKSRTLLLANKQQLGVAAWLAEREFLRELRRSIGGREYATVESIV